jgi:hypothetical protein
MLIARPLHALVISPIDLTFNLRLDLLAVRFNCAFAVG